ncbi:MAG: glycosyltransferase [Alphaproteobacteria bacterium]
MNILHIIFTNEFAGSERYACQLASLQAAAGERVFILVRGWNEAYVGRMVREAAPATVVTVPWWWPSVLGHWAVRRAVARLKPTVVHTHLGRATKAVGKALAVMAGQPKHVATLHLEYRKEYAVCDGLICIAAWQKAGVKAGGYKGKVAVVWNWAMPRPAGAPEVRTGFTFLSVGRLVPNKGMDVLIRAFRQAFAKGEEASLVIAGDGPERAALEALAEGDPRITVLGYVADVGALYPAAKVYVSAARYEPFGLTILEAMQAGCRLVCTRTQGPSEFLADFSPHWAEMDDVASLAKALKAGYKASVNGRVGWEMEAFSAPRALEKILRAYNNVDQNRR